MLNAQLQYRRTETEALNVFPNLGGTTTNTSISAPISLNVARGRSIQNFTVNLTHATVQSTNAFSGTDNVAGEAGIKYPGAAATDPLNWGVPNLSFSGFTGVRSAVGQPSHRRSADDELLLAAPDRQASAPNRRRLSARPLERREQLERARQLHLHRALLVRRDRRSPARTAPTSPISCSARRSRRRSRSAALTHLRQHSFDAYVEDNWQKSAKLTFNLGLRYELALPYVEVNGQMANLDVTPDFTAAAPVVAGGSRTLHGRVPGGPVEHRRQQPRAAPRRGVPNHPEDRSCAAATASPTTAASYASIARQLVGQPPFAETETVIGTTTTAPLTLADALLVVDTGDDEQLRRGPGLRARHDPDVECDHQPRHRQELDDDRGLHRHQGHQPRHPARAQSRTGRPADSRRAGRSPGNRPAATRS